MSNRNPDARYESLPQALAFVFRQLMKDVHTAIPGIVQRYSPATKRAMVQPSINLLLTDGNSKPKPPIVDVPVQQVSTGGHLVHHQINVGDVVLLVFSERGLDNFKEAWGQLADPPPEAMFEAHDAMALPWGTETITPVRSTGWVAQNAAGTVYVSVDRDTIRLVAGRSSITMDDAGITLRGPTDVMVIP